MRRSQDKREHSVSLIDALQICSTRARNGRDFLRDFGRMWEGEAFLFPTIVPVENMEQAVSDGEGFCDLREPLLFLSPKCRCVMRVFFRCFRLSFCFLRASLQSSFVSSPILRSPDGRRLRLSLDLSDLCNRRFSRLWLNILQ